MPSIKNVEPPICFALFHAVWVLGNVRPLLLRNYLRHPFFNDALSKNRFPTLSYHNRSLLFLRYSDHFQPLMQLLCHKITFSDHYLFIA